jgi:hypothetical protein
MKSESFTIPVVSFRHLDTPFTKSGYKDYFAVVKVKDLPDLAAWRRINVRHPKLTGSVPKKISNGYKECPEMFVFMNRGIVLAVHSVSFDNKTNEMTVKMTNPAAHGLLDGGHTYNIVCGENDLDFDQYVKVEILEGFDNEDVPNLVDARNTSNQVKDESLMNLREKFKPLQNAIKGKPYEKLIAYSEFQVDGDGNAKPIDIRDVIAILTAFEKKNFNDSVHPINSYRSKAACLTHFRDHEKDYEKLYPIADDLLRLYDTIKLELPELYNTARGSKGDVSGGKFGKLTGVTVYKGNKSTPLHFIGKETKRGVPEGFVFPILGAFRAFLEKSPAQYRWAKGIDPFSMIKGDFGLSLASTIGTFALDAKNPSKTGKSPLVWQACYQTAQLEHLKRKHSKTA